MRVGVPQECPTLGSTVPRADPVALSEMVNLTKFHHPIFLDVEDLEKSVFSITDN